MASDLIDTRAVRYRRALRLESAAEVLAEIDALVAAEGEGRLRRTGNWTLGQTLAHLAAWASYPFEGYPEGATPSWPVRAIGRALKRAVLARPLPAGYRIPGAPGGTWGVENLGAEEGAARCRRAFERLEREAPTMPNPVFGRMSHEEWKRINRGHAELHLSFFHIDGA